MLFKEYGEKSVKYEIYVFNFCINRELDKHVLWYPTAEAGAVNAFLSSRFKIIGQKIEKIT